MKIPLVTVALLLGLTAVCVFHDYDRLPDPMASHFGVDGRPDGWMSRSGFFAIQLGVTLLTQGVILGLAFLVGRFPDRLINLPHRDYWLMPERRAETLAYLQRQIAWSAAIVMLFLLVSLQLVLRANFSSGGRLAVGWLWLVLGLLIVTTMIIPIRILMKFSRR